MEKNIALLSWTTLYGIRHPQHEKSVGFSNCEQPEVIRKILQHFNLWQRPQRSPPPRLFPHKLLTSSDVPGHVMKVTDYKKAQGAIVGKALGSIENGRDLILVLLNLQ